MPRIFCAAQSGAATMSQPTAIKSSDRSSSNERMRRGFLLFMLLLFGCTKSHAEKAISAGAPIAGEPDYAAWNHLLAKYYDQAHGMDYARLKANDSATLEHLRQRLGRVAVGTLT